jgi:hypothetical protein
MLGKKKFTSVPTLHRMYTVYQRKITRAMNSLGFEGEACELKCTAYKVHLNFLEKTSYQIRRNDFAPTGNGF